MDLCIISRILFIVNSRLKQVLPKNYCEFLYKTHKNIRIFDEYIREFKNSYATEQKSVVNIGQIIYNDKDTVKFSLER